MEGDDVTFSTSDVMSFGTNIWYDVLRYVALLFFLQVKDTIKTIQQ